MKRKRNYTKRKKPSAGRLDFSRLQNLEFSFLTIQKHLGFFIFLAMLAICYIGNGYQVEKCQKNLKKIEKENNNLKGQLMSTASELMQTSTQSTVAEKVSPLGIFESTESPKVIYFEKE